MKIGKILVPTDFSDNATHALTYAVELAKQSSAELHVLHVPVIPTYLLMDLSYNPGPEAVTRILNQSQDLLGEVEERLSTTGVKHTAVVREGMIHETIRDYARDQAIDLVVLGTHGRSGVSRLMYGSVTERVLKTVHVPTIVVPLGKTEPPNSIVVAYDFSEPAKQAAEAARALHGLFHGAIHMVHVYLDVWGEYTDRGAVTGQAATKRREALKLGLEEMLHKETAELFSIDAQSIQTHLVSGDPTEGILALAKEVKADLICAGITGKTGLERLLIGSVARRMLHESKMPLLLVHAATA